MTVVPSKAATPGGETMADTGTHSRLRGRIKAALKAMPGASWSRTATLVTAPLT